MTRLPKGICELKRGNLKKPYYREWTLKGEIKFGNQFVSEFGVTLSFV